MRPNITLESVALSLLLWASQTNAANLISRQKTALDNSATSSNLTSKAGLAWANGDRVDIRQFQSEKVSWYYTWSIWPVGGRRNTLEFVPMLWGPKSMTEFTSKINDAVRTSRRSGGRNITAILGMNEPEQPGQANMTATEGVEFWKTHLEPLREALGVRLGSPGVSSAPSAKAWLEDFFRECNGDCTVDFIALHWYGTNADRFIAHLWDYYYAFNRAIWVTEWACHNFVDKDEQCSADEVALFLNKTQSFMDNTSWIERYSWFGALTDLQGVNQANALLGKDGKISELGSQYIGSVGRQEPLETSQSVEISAHEVKASLFVTSMLSCALFLVSN